MYDLVYMYIELKIDILIFFYVNNLNLCKILDTFIYIMYHFYPVCKFYVYIHILFLLTCVLHAFIRQLNILCCMVNDK